MKKSLKIFSALLAILTLSLTLLSTATATYTPDYKSTHTATGGGVTLTKSAEWIDVSKTKAKVTIKADFGDEAKSSKVNNIDVIYLLDKSDSMGGDVGVSFANVRSIMLEQLNYFIENGNNVNVAFASFASRLYTYDNGGKQLHEYYRALSGAAGAALGRKGGKGDYSETWSDANYKMTSTSVPYNTAKSRINTAFAKSGALKFYSTTLALNEVKSGASQHGDGENTNFDLGLFAAKYLMDNRADKNRKTYIIFITEGQPYPDTDKKRANFATDTDWPRNADYVSNKYYNDISKEIRNAGGEIYAIILDRNKSNDAMWKKIVGSSSHLYYVKDTKNAALAAIRDFNSKVNAKIVESANSIKSAKLEDIINYNDFKFVDGSIEVNIGKASYDAKTNKVIWNIGSNLKYGVKGDNGNVPTLTFEVELKDINKSGWVNTNYIDGDKDKATELTYDDNKITVETPWLEREPGYKVIIKYINDDPDTQKGMPFMQPDIVSDPLKEGDNWPSSGKIIDDYRVTDTRGQWNKGAYENDTEKIIVDGITYNASNIPTVLNNIRENKVVEFHYKLKNGKATIRTFNVDYIYDFSGTPRTSITGPITTTESTVKYGINNKATKPSGISGNYMGSKLTYGTSNPVMTDTDLKNLSNKTDVTYKLDDDNYCATIDFVFKKSSYPVIIHYEDQDGNPIPGYPDVTKQIEEGQSFDPTVPSEIETKDAVYKYIERSDKKPQKDPIGPVTGPIRVVIKYKKTYTINIKFVDAITNKDIVPGKTIKGKDYNSNISRDEIFSGVTIPNGYKFIRRLNIAGEKSTDINDGIGPIKKSDTYTYYYRRSGGPGGSGGTGYDPVVSYPEINVKSVMLGSDVEITIPNNGTHLQMDKIGEEEPLEGWNGAYAQKEYINCDFDFYYNGELKNAGTDVEVATRSVIEKGDVKVTITIPEWVPEGEHIIKCKVANVASGTRTGTFKYNTLYDENQAMNTVKIEVIGKIYDFTITNLVEDKMWSTSLFATLNEYKARNAVDKANKIGALPIGQGTLNQKPIKYNYGMSLGSTFFFDLKTIGVKNKMVEVLPKLVYIDESGNVTDAKFYSLVKGQYVELGDNDSVKLQTTIDNEYRRIRTELPNEIKFASESPLKLNASSLKLMNDIGTYSHLYITSKQKVPFAKYIDIPGVTTNRTVYSKLPAEKQKALLEAVGHWYGEYRLPSSLIAMPNTSTENPNTSRKTELKNGYIMVLFKINSVSTENLNNVSANKYLTYEKQTINGVEFDEWKEESGYDSVNKTSKMPIVLPLIQGQTTEKTINYTLEDGYYPVAIYQSNRRISGQGGNYEIAGTH